LATSKNASRAVPEERAATPDEITAAIDGLSATDWYRLRKYGDHLIVLLAEKAGDRRGADLLNEAFMRLLKRSRKWDKTKVDFFNFLIGAMKSIANAWLRKKVSPTEQPVLASALVTEDDEGTPTDPAEEFKSIEKSAEIMLVYKEVVHQIEGLFPDDELASAVIEALREGYSPPEVRAFWNLSQTDYNAVMVKIRRRVAKAGITDPRPESQHVQ
jgi:DNA-directed RNA polymerase specialized sigma24 family protein